MKQRPTRLRPHQGGAMRSLAPQLPPTLTLGDNRGAFATPSDTRAAREAGRELRIEDSPKRLEHHRGRCFLCTSPVDNERAYAVCAACDGKHQVRDRWQAAYELEESCAQASSDRECFCEGWLWMNEADDGSFNIERCDTCMIFADDTAAAAEVLGCSPRAPSLKLTGINGS